MGKWRIWALLALCNLFWAGNYVFGKYVIAEMTPLWITFSRWFLALFILVPIARCQEKPDWRTLQKDWFWLLCMALLGIIGYNIFLYSALEYTTATNAALVSALNPGVIVMCSVVLLRERISRLQTAGFLVSLIGALVVLTRGDLARLLRAEFNYGDLLMVGAVIIWTLYSLVGKKITTPPITAIAASAAMAVLLTAPFVAVQGIDFAKIGPLTITGILYMVFFPSVCSFVFWNMSVRAIGASEAGVFLNLIPVFTAIISGLLGEKITGAQISGGLLVFLGVYLTTGLLEKKVPQEQ